MSRRFSKAEIRNLRDELDKLEWQEAEQEKRLRRRKAEKWEAECRAAHEKQRKDYENLPWWSKLASCWIDMCCTIRHPIEGPEVIIMFIANVFLLAAAVCIPVMIFGVTFQIFYSLLYGAYLH